MLEIRVNEIDIKHGTCLSGDQRIKVSMTL